MTVLASSSEIVATGRRPGLLWSEYGFLLAAAIAVVITLGSLESDILTREAAIRHLMLMILVPAFVLTLTGRAMRTPVWQRTRRTSRVLRAAWPILGLGVLIVVGSLYARFVNDIQNTFLVVGLYMLTTACAALMVLQTDAPESLLRGYFRILLLTATVMGITLIINFRVRQVYHEQIFLVIPMAVLFFARTNRSFVDWTACAFFLSMAVFSQKYTSYLIGAIAVAYMAVAVAYPRLTTPSKLHRVTIAYWFCVLTIVVAALAYVTLRGSAALPSGNLEYRLHTYAAAWDRFTASPWWGNLFTGEAAEKFTLYDIGIARNVLPTHSDVLDLLANGGIIAGALWAIGLASAARMSWRKVLCPKFLDDPCARYGHALAVMSIAAVVTYAFNPILLQPAMAFLVWCNLGMLLGLSLRDDR